MFTLTEAAKETGLTRAGIHKAIKAGRLSATKNDDGNYLIDAAELFRVYQPVSSTINRELTKDDTSVDTVDYQLIAQKLEYTQQLLKQVESERDSLRHDKEYLQQNLNHALLMLTHQPAQPVHQPDIQPVKSRLYEKLFGRKR